ncbi:MAG: GNAT family N-acetyltransferase [Anaerolineae bacterium]|jgi:RimJ/RimL family protein N-acetyltransferase|nr:GNAT family N-acetyltransferase [Anaerolineae bacterium]MBT7073577.1 GNAT family N-acetyltransferase [Anaerolineae bacterium]MBT7782127.1 GNAT family N-acetyltransferase [Anaerolineae bacterium]
MDISFRKLITPNAEIARIISEWENDSELIPLIRPNFTKEALALRQEITVETLSERLKYIQIYLIFVDGKMVGEMNYQIDPQHLYLKEKRSAWIGIYIGDRSVHGKGVGTRAMKYLEEEIKRAGLKRIELGVFEYNRNAMALYQKMGYQEIGRIDGFTYWKGKMWQDIRMEIRFKEK